MKKNNHILVGAHMSTAKSLHLAFARGESIGCTAMQIFTKSCRTVFGNPISLEEEELFKQKAKESTIQSVISHAGYLLNLASKNAKTAHQSHLALVHELERCAQLGIKTLVLHPGAHMGEGENEGIKKIATSLDAALEKTDTKVSLLLETMAKQGTTLGGDFEQLEAICALCKHRNRIGICIDTCHIFAAGYDLLSEEGYEKVIEHFDKIIGLSHLKAMHINDSQKSINSHVDRHAPLGKGKIPLKIFEIIMNDKRLENIPKILETPTDAGMNLWQQEIALLKNFVQ